MTKIGLFVGEDLWSFFHEIYSDLSINFDSEIFHRKRYRVPIISGRLNHWAYVEGIRSMLRRNDVCFFEWASEYLAIASHLPKYCPIITRLHSFELFDWAPKIEWKSVDKIILVSQAMKDHFDALYPECIKKSCVVYNGCSLDKFKPIEKKKFHFNIGMLADLFPEKRIYEIILMVNTLVERGYRPHLRIAGGIGNARYAESLYRLVKTLQLQDYVTFFGRIDYAPSWLHEIDIFISNSYWEGQQVALLEAMASGCYCLSHSWAGADEVLPTENLYIDQDELIAKLLGFANLSETEQRDKSALFRTLAEAKFNITATAQNIHQIIDSVVLGKSIQ